MLTIDDMIRVLAETPAWHNPGSLAFAVLDDACGRAFDAARHEPGAAEYYETTSFGTVHFPLKSMGAVSSYDIFRSTHELILFSFYLANRRRYRRVVDIGGNIGLHSIIMSRLGWTVTTFEPDPVHVDLLRRNLVLNGIAIGDSAEVGMVCLKTAAVAQTDRDCEFVRVLGNTTSSHLAGAKDHPYGPLERFTVKSVSAVSALAGADFVKVDAEGAERDIVEALGRHDFARMEMMLEVGGDRAATAIFDHANSIGVNIFSQLIGWRRASTPADMPKSYKDGSVFLSTCEVMPWGDGSDSRSGSP